MDWVFLSPHLDDVAISCAGLVWELTQQDHPVSIWSICAGKPPAGPLSPFAQSLHARWNTGSQTVRTRRAEDQRSCLRMGAQPVYLDIPDCIYRTARKTNAHLYPSEESLFGPVHPAEARLIQHLSRRLLRSLPEDAQIVCPLALGSHVDHQLTRLSAEQTGRSLLYYADYPYAHQAENELASLQLAGWQPQLWPVSPEALQEWIAAVWEHRSQISTFWSGLEDVHSHIAAYCQQMGGVRLWSSPPKAA
ncbi:MAG TPA: PIG-L family deacetylase [Anaerolineales bacterium]|nr:PIG-L family deacetylase [Anaerolineales bacterium]